MDVVTDQWNIEIRGEYQLAADLFEPDEVAIKLEQSRFRRTTVAENLVAQPQRGAQFTPDRDAESRLDREQSTISRTVNIHNVVGLANTECADLRVSPLLRDPVTRSNEMKLLGQADLTTVELLKYEIESRRVADDHGAVEVRCQPQNSRCDVIYFNARRKYRKFPVRLGADLHER